MKRKYEMPVAKKVTFDFEQILAQSSVCGSGIVLTHEPGTRCGSMTPTSSFPGSGSSYAFIPNPDVCGWQSGPNN